MVGPGCRSVGHYTKSPFKSSPGPHWVNPSLFTDYDQSLRLVDLDVEHQTIQWSIIHVVLSKMSIMFRMSNYSFN